jgi:hypothetical protein
LPVTHGFERLTQGDDDVDSAPAFAKELTRARRELTWRRIRTSKGTRPRERSHFFPIEDVRAIRLGRRMELGAFETPYGRGAHAEFASRLVPRERRGTLSRWITASSGSFVAKSELLLPHFSSTLSTQVVVKHANWQGR